MGEVYLARQVALNRPVAIKFLTRTAGDPPDEYEVRFHREAELMARVSHPNVVTIFDFGTVDGRPYLVMEYVEGGDLRSRMVPDLPMKTGEIQAIIKPVVRALEYLHRQGIVHRDMKPENILMHHEETPKVTDFGIAVLDFAIGSLTRTGQSLGTPGYVAPEQQYGLKVDERADQFSLAALCYEMATGRKPLGSFPPPAKLNPKLGRVPARPSCRALSDDPADRFPTIGEFGEALDRGLALGRVPEVLEGSGRLVAALAVLGVLAGVGLVAFLSPDSAGKPGVRPANAGRERTSRGPPPRPVVARQDHGPGGGHDPGRDPGGRVLDGLASHGPRRPARGVPQASRPDLPAVLPRREGGHRRPVPQVRRGDGLHDLGREEASEWGELGRPRIQPGYEDVGAEARAELEESRGSRSRRPTTSRSSR